MTVAMQSSAPTNRLAEYIRVFSIVISELKFSDVQMQILFANFVECADDPALQDRPEAFDGLRMNCAVNVLVRPVVNDAMRVSLLSKALVSGPVVRAQQGNLVRDRLVDECAQGFTLNVLDDAGNDVALATDCADNNRLAFPIALTAALVPMPVARVAADNCFIHFDDPGELLHVLHHCGSDLVAHEPSRFVGAEAHVAVDLKGAHALLADQHQVRDSEPILEGLIRIFKNCSGKTRETIASIAARSALRTLPMPCPGMQLIDGRIATARTNDALRPSANDQIRFAVVLSLKQSVKLRCGHLMDGLRLLCAGHNDISPSIGELSHV